MANTTASSVTGMPLPEPFLRGFRDAMERLSDGPLAPALDLYTTPAAIVAKVALPGVERQNIDVKVGDDLVTISGSVKPETEARDVAYVHKELRHGAFNRSFWLRAFVMAEAATASLEDGLLTLILPKTDHPTLTRTRVEVT